MRPNALTLLTGALGLAGVVAARAVRRRRAGPPAGAPPADPRAEELRRRLAEARGLDEEREEFEAAETPVDAVEPAGDLDERRRRIHEDARAAAERMRGAPPTA